jgi:Na+(H+)/acetate symporter ActP
MNIDLYILAFSAVTVLATIWMGFRSAKKSKTASDFFVAGRSVGVGMNASAISGEYLSAASFMGIAGMVMSSGYDALWYPVCYACGYLFLLLFIAGPLRRFGAYTIPDFAEGRFDSPVFRKIAVVFVLFIGFFYTMPQMKGAGVTLAYIFPGLPYWAGVVLVGAVITLNVAMGGMKGITLVQAFQYWAKMFAISVPIFVLMVVYGHYGKQVGVNDRGNPVASETRFNDSRFERIGGDRPFAATNDNFVQRTKFYGERAVKGQTLEFNHNGRNPLGANLELYSTWAERVVFMDTNLLTSAVPSFSIKGLTHHSVADQFVAMEKTNGIEFVLGPTNSVFVVRAADANALRACFANVLARQALPPKAPADATWLNPFGPLTTKAAKNAAAAIGKRAANEVGRAVLSAPERRVNSNATVAIATRRSEDTAPYPSIPFRSDITPGQHLTVALDSPTVAQALAVYAELTGRKLVPNTNSVAERVDDLLNGKLSKLKLIARGATPDSGVRFHADGLFTADEVKRAIEQQLRTNGLAVIAVGAKAFRVERAPGILPAQGSEQTESAGSSTVPTRQDSGGTLGAAAEKAWLTKHEKPLALLYTYSLIIAIVCGTAGLPHILVRFYTNPDGTAAKKTTMWVMILIGVFYVFPPVFGVIGRNLMPDLYSGVGAKGTDKIVLELPRILNQKYAPLGSILSGITCAGAFAAFMSTFSGLLVSMTGALAHDVYGRILRPKSTPEQRMRMFKIGAVLIGGIAILLGSFVEPLEINFMVGQAFAIAAASYFPLLFMAVWWRKLTMKGAAIGMLAGGVCALVAAALTNFSNLASDKGPMGKVFSGFAPLNDFWAAHPLLRILCEQPAIWAVPLAIVLMIVVSKLTAKTIPADSRMKMLVLHAPEQLGLKQEYIQEHAPH